MYTELRLDHNITGSNKHGKSAKDISITDLEKLLTCQKQHQEAMFRASKQHATGTYHGKEEHGMLVLDALNKTPSLNMIQKGSENTIASM